MRLISILALLVAAAAMSVTAAYGSSVHFKKGGAPVCTITGTTSITTSCTATVAGLGGENIEVDLTTGGFAVYQCQNNGGATAPGQNRVLVGPDTTPTFIDASQIKNGNLTFTASNAGHELTASGTVSGADAGCPNPNWTGVNPQLTLTDITLTFQQPVGTVVFTCTAHSDTGLTGTVRPTCTFS